MNFGGEDWSGPRINFQGAGIWGGQFVVVRQNKPAGVQANFGRF